MNETNHPSEMVTCTLIQDLLGVTDGGIYEAVVNLKAQLDAVVAINANHVQTLAGIRNMDPATEGQRMQQWASDALSGYTDPVEATVKSLMDENQVLVADRERIKKKVLCIAQSAVSEIAYAIFNLSGKSLDSLSPSAVETTCPADSGLIAERYLRNLIIELREGRV